MDVLKRRRIITLVSGLGVSALALAGCSSGGGGSEESDTLTVWFPGTNAAEISLVTDTLVPAFEEETGVEVEVTFLDYGDMSTKLNAAFAAGNAPDIFGHGPAAIADFVVNERIEPLDDFVESMPESDQADLADAFEGGQVDGTQYLVPLSIQSNLIAYDRADLREAGLGEELDVSSWEELREVAEQLTVRDGDKVTRAGLLLPSASPGNQQAFLALLASAGGQLISDDGEASAFNTPEGLAALEYFVDLYQGDDAIGNQLGAQWTDSPPTQQPLMLDQASIAIMPSFRVSALLATDPDFAVAVAPPMTLGDGDEGHYVGGAGPGLMISSDAPDKELAWDFIQYLLSPEVSEQYVEGIGAIPARQSAIDTPYVADDPLMTQYVELIPTYVPNPTVPGWIAARDAMSSVLEQALNGQVTPQEALDRMQTEIDEILASAR